MVHLGLLVATVIDVRDVVREPEPAGDAQRDQAPPTTGVVNQGIIAPGGGFEVCGRRHPGGDDGEDVGNGEDGGGDDGVECQF